MALFGLFKSKDERKMEDLFRKMQEMMFPGGENDFIRDCKRINELTEGKIPADKLRGFVSGCKSLLYVSQSEEESRFVSSYMTHAEGRISEAEAYAMYAYFEGEASYYDKMTINIKSMGGNVSEAQELFGDMLLIYSAGTKNDDISGGYGEYGLTVTNPVPTISIKSSNRYLASLRLDGRPLVATRIGSTSTDVTPGSVDIYRLTSDGGDVVMVYLCPYHKRNSRKTPKGFSLV